MARKHYYQWLLNQEGQPISNADIYIYLAETAIAAKLYTSETGSSTLDTSPQLSTTNLGYFEFWIGDSNDTNGYERTQKFKIRWDRAGVEEGYIDNVSIFETDIEEVDETDTGTDGDSLHKNKLISNYLARKWNTLTGITMNSSLINEDYEILESDLLETLFLSGGPTIYLPDVAIKRKIRFANYDTTTSTISASNGSIQGSSTITLVGQYTTKELESDGIDTWYQFI